MWSLRWFPSSDFWAWVQLIFSNEQLQPFICITCWLWSPSEKMARKQTNKQTKTVVTRSPVVLPVDPVISKWKYLDTSPHYTIKLAFESLELRNFPRLVWQSGFPLTFAYVIRLKAKVSSPQHFSEIWAKWVDSGCLTSSVFKQHSPFSPLTSVSPHRL